MGRDAFQLVQEAVANWESLEGVVGVDVVEQWLGNTSERGFAAKVTLIDQAEPIYIELTIVDPHERMEALFEARFQEGLPFRPRDESWE